MGDYRIPIYFDDRELEIGSARCLFDDPALRCICYPWSNDYGPEADVRDSDIVFRKFRRFGPFEQGEPLVFSIYDAIEKQWILRGSFVWKGSANGITSIALTSLEPAQIKGNQRELLNHRVLDECDFPRLVRYAVATRRSSLSRFEQRVLGTDDRLQRFFDDLRYYKIEQDDFGRGFDYVPAITAKFP